MTAQPTEENPLYYLVVIPDIGEPEVEALTTLQEVAARLIELEGTDVTVMPFCGRRLYISEGPMQFLYDEGYADAIPLFTVPNWHSEETRWSSQARLGSEEIKNDLLLGSPTDVSEESADDVSEEEDE